MRRQLSPGWRMVRALRVHVYVCRHKQLMERRRIRVAYGTRGQDEVDACPVIVDTRPRRCAPTRVCLTPVRVYNPKLILRPNIR